MNASMSLDSSVGLPFHGFSNAPQYRHNRLGLGSSGASIDKKQFAIIGRQQPVTSRGRLRMSENRGIIASPSKMGMEVGTYPDPHHLQQSRMSEDPTNGNPGAGKTFRTFRHCASSSLEPNRISLW